MSYRVATWLTAVLVVSSTTFSPGHPAGPSLNGMIGHEPSVLPSSHAAGSKSFAKSSASSSRWNTELTIANSVPAGAIRFRQSVGSRDSRSTTSVVGQSRSDSWTAAPATASNGEASG